jgi:hypothetical protein
MRVAALLLALLALASCGVESKPRAPNGSSPNPIVSITGSGQIGVGANL